MKSFKQSLVEESSLDKLIKELLPAVKFKSASVLKDGTILLSDVKDVKLASKEIKLIGKIIKSDKSSVIMDLE